MNALCSAQHPARQFVNGGKPPDHAIWVRAGQWPEWGQIRPTADGRVNGTEIGYPTDVLH
jgi:hypothetical protein